TTPARGSCRCWAVTPPRRASHAGAELRPASHQGVPMSDFTATDHLMMARALRLAERGAYTTRPNPMVGCVIARGDEVVGGGFHQRAGEAHEIGRASCRERGYI